MENAQLLPSPQTAGTGWPWDNTIQELSAESVDEKSSLPKISIVTPSFNQGQYLEKTIRSVLLQGYPNLEYIIIDGGSTDDSVSVIKRYGPWLAHWESGPDRGQAHALNKGFQRATGEIFAWLNSDDFYLPGVLRYVAQEFKKRPHAVGALVGEGHIINEQGDIVYTPTANELSRNALLHWMGYGDFMQPSCFFRAAAWKKCGPLREDLHYALDVDLWIKIIQSFTFERLSGVLSHSLSHKNAKTTAERERMRAETIWLVMGHGGEDAGRKAIFKMADELADAKQKLNRIRSTISYKLFYPAYVRLQKIFKR